MITGCPIYSRLKTIYGPVWRKDKNNRWSRYKFPVPYSHEYQLVPRMKSVLKEMTRVTDSSTPRLFSSVICPTSSQLFLFIIPRQPTIDNDISLSTTSTRACVQHNARWPCWRQEQPTTGYNATQIMSSNRLREKLSVKNLEEYSAPRSHICWPRPFLRQ